MELRRLTEAIRSSQAPAGVKTRIVAIDGQGAAGKSTLASLLAQQLDAPIIQTDDFASWENPVDWWPELIARALEPLAAGEPARYDPTSWGGEEREPLLIEPSACHPGRRHRVARGIPAIPRLFDLDRDAVRPAAEARPRARRRAGSGSVGAVDGRGGSLRRA
jgi:hypothetical protein